MNNEPITITVGEWRVYTLHDGALAAKRGGDNPQLIMGHHDLIAALARELAEARSECVRLRDGQNKARNDYSFLSIETEELRGALAEARKDAANARPKVDVDALVNRFLACPLPDSVCADKCATMQGHPHRSGTNLLTFTEAKAMFEQCLGDNDQPPDQLAQLRHALHRIAAYDEQPIWSDDRDDAANDMLGIARSALGMEEET